jgi:PST family polysaccharide transporter
MKPILRAIGLMSGASAVSVVLGLVTAKVTASVLGPPGVGLLGLLQSTVGLAFIGALTGGVSAGMVRDVSRARADGDARGEASAIAGAWRLGLGCAMAMAAAMILARSTVARVFLGDADRASAVVPLAGAMVLTAVTTVQVGVISAYHQIGRVARINISNSVAGPIILVPLVLMWHAAALPWIVLGGSVATAMASAYWYPREAPGLLASLAYPSQSGVVATASRRLLRFALPFNLSAMAGTGVALAMPVIVLHALGDAAVGFFRAAAGISLTYLAFLQSALGQDYYPRLAACGDDRPRLARLVDDQMRAMLLVAGPIILAILAAAPLLVPLIYTRDFVPAVALLEWQLAGDVLRVAAVTMGFGVLARAGAAAFLTIELVNGSVTLVLSLIGVRAGGLPGLGMAFFASSAAAAVVNAVALRRAAGTLVTGRTVGLLGAYTAAALLLRLISSADVGVAGTVAAGGVALVGVALSLRSLWAEVEGWRGIRKLFRPA